VASCSGSARLISAMSASAPPCASSTSIAAHPSQGPTLTELTMIIRWWMRVTLERNMHPGGKSADQDQNLETGQTD
jgi:hypothetical protein